VPYRTHTTAESPIGQLTLLAVDGRLAGLYLDRQRHPPDPESFGERDGHAFVDVIRQLDEYFAGRRRAFDVPLTLTGTPFQRLVWSALRRVGYGQTTTYGELAEEVGRPGAARAVGLANGRNPISVIVPCHRVLGADGSLTGYGGGLERKRFLLDLESRP
jgi:methylated-DNA-[protein]-cysteine S-methyltransferase